MSFRGALFIGVCLVALMPAASAVGEEAMKVSASAKAACMPDAMRSAAIPCRTSAACWFASARNRDKISGRCNAVLASYGL